jgi:hypothetical protein
MQRFPFTDFFNSALHVSGDSFAHPQEHFNCIYSFWYNAPTLLATGNMDEVERTSTSSVLPVGSIVPKAVRVYVYTVEVRNYRPTHVYLI